MLVDLFTVVVDSHSSTVSILKPSFCCLMFICPLNTIICISIARPRAQNIAVRIITSQINIQINIRSPLSLPRFSLWRDDDGTALFKLWIQFAFRHYRPTALIHSSVTQDLPIFNVNEKDSRQTEWLSKLKGFRIWSFLDMGIRPSSEYWTSARISKVGENLWAWRTHKHTNTRSSEAEPAFS